MRSIGPAVTREQSPAHCSPFSDYNTMRLEINYREKTAKIQIPKKKKNTNTCKLNNMQLKQSIFTKEIKEEI